MGLRRFSRLKARLLCLWWRVKGYEAKVVEFGPGKPYHKLLLVVKGLKKWD